MTCIICTSRGKASAIILDTLLDLMSFFLFVLLVSPADLNLKAATIFAEFSPPRHLDINLIEN